MEGGESARHKGRTFFLRKGQKRTQHNVREGRIRRINRLEDGTCGGMRSSMELRQSDRGCHFVLCFNIKVTDNLENQVIHKQGLQRIFTDTYIKYQKIRTLINSLLCTWPQAHYFTLEIQFFFFFLSFCPFQGCTHDTWRFPGQGSNQSCSCQPRPQPRQCQI